MFSPEQVKTLARAHGLVPLSHSEDLGAISFKYPGLPWRIAVFYTTQTAVVSISDAAGNSSKQAIRDSISLSDLENLFQHPKTNGLVAVTGSCFRQSPPPLPEKQKHGKNRRGWDPTESLTVENDLNDKAIEAAMREHLQDLQGQVLGCQETLEKFQERRRKQEAEEMRRASKFLLRTISAEKSRKNTIQEDVGRFDRKSSEISIDTQGVAFDYSLVYSNGLPRRLSEVRCVAISPEGGFAVVSKTGACVYHKVPPQLSALLDQNEKAGIDYISIGPQGQFIIQLSNGHLLSHGSNDLKKRLSNTLRIVEFACFGGMESYFIKFSDGSYIWNEIPPKIEELVSNGRNTLDFLWLSEHGREFFASFNNGSLTVDGRPSFPAFLADIVSSKRVKRLQFMETSRVYFVEYFLQ